MKTEIRIPIHSMIDVITNSSTEIFVHSEKSVEPCKELINEFLKLMGLNKTWDEVFELSIEKSDSGLEDFIEYYLDDSEYKIDNKKQFREDIKNGKYPDWWEEASDDYDLEYHTETFLVIKAKDKKYAKFAELLKDFLYSAEWYEHSNE